MKSIKTQTEPGLLKLLECNVVLGKFYSCCWEWNVPR